MSKTLVIYHKSCMDGAAAALAAWLKFGEEAEYRPASYGDPAPTDEEVRGRDVYILDFSYPRAELERMALTCRSSALAGYKAGQLQVCDHHKTAQADLTGLPFCTFDMNKSGAVLAWEYFHGTTLDPVEQRIRGEVLPELFAYVQDRDLWRWELPHSKEVSAALAASGALRDFRVLRGIYAGWSASYRTDLSHAGAAILRAECQMIERAVATAEEVDILDPGYTMAYRALAVSTMSLQSEIGEALALESARRGRDAIGVVYYKHGPSGNKSQGVLERGLVYVRLHKLEELNLITRHVRPRIGYNIHCYALTPWGIERLAAEKRS